VRSLTVYQTIFRTDLLVASLGQFPLLILIERIIHKIAEYSDQGGRLFRGVSGYPHHTDANSQYIGCESMMRCQGYQTD